MLRSASLPGLQTWSLSSNVPNNCSTGCDQRGQLIQVTSNREGGRRKGERERGREGEKGN